jgi:RNA polymerase sigma factor (sigma-70 family)
MHRTLLPASELRSSLESLALLCCSAGCWDETDITTVAAFREDLVDWRPVEWLDDAAMVAVVQAFLRCRRARRIPSRSQQRAWDHFFRRYYPLVRAAVAVSCRDVASRVEHDDVSQEVWDEILIQLPRLAHWQIRASLSSWLMGLVRQKVRRLASRLSRCAAGPSLDVARFADSLRSKDSSPEDMYFMQELWAQLQAALERLRHRTSERTYAVFCRRLFQRQSFKEIAAALKLTSSQARLRYHRAHKKWRVLTDGLALVGCPLDVSSPANSPLPRKAR